MKYSELAAINVNEHVEKKNNLSYLSWAWAVDTLLRHDEDATWSYGEPTAFKDGTVMMYCTVNAFGRSRTAQLPVMDYKNKSIAEPDAIQVNVTMQRVLAKAIALHGLGLYIYAGEDLPMQDESPPPSRLNFAAVTASKADLTPDPVENNAREIVVPPSDNEALAVDWVCSFVDEFLPSFDNIQDLREFWKINKSVLTRVEKFSKPMYEVLETNFKERAVQIRSQT